MSCQKSLPSPQSSDVINRCSLIIEHKNFKEKFLLKTISKQTLTTQFSNQPILCNFHVFIKRTLNTSKKF